MERSSGFFVFCHFLSAALRGVLSVLMDSDSHGAGWVWRAGFDERGQWRSNAEETEERKEEHAVSGGRDRKASGVGREEIMEDERLVGFSVFRLRRDVTIFSLGLGRRVDRDREKVTK